MGHLQWTKESPSFSLSHTQCEGENSDWNINDDEDKNGDEDWDRSVTENGNRDGDENGEEDGVERESMNLQSDNNSGGMEGTREEVTPMGNQQPQP